MNDGKLTASPPASSKSTSGRVFGALLPVCGSNGDSVWKIGGPDYKIFLFDVVLTNCECS